MADKGLKIDSLLKDEYSALSCSVIIFFSFSSTDVENTVDIPEVLDKTKGLGRLKNVFKMSAIECYEGKYIMH